MQELNTPDYVASLKSENRPKAVTQQKRLEAAIYREKATQFKDELAKHYNWFSIHAEDIARAQKSGFVKVSYKMSFALERQKKTEDDIKRPFEATDKTLQEIEETQGLRWSNEPLNKPIKRLSSLLDKHAESLALAKKRGLTNNALLDGLKASDRQSSGRANQDIRNECYQDGVTDVGWDSAIKYVSKQLEQAGFTPEERETHLLIMTLSGEIFNNFLLQPCMREISKIKGEKLKDTYLRYRSLLRDFESEILGTGGYRGQMGGTVRDAYRYQGLNLYEQT